MSVLKKKKLYKIIISAVTDTHRRGGGGLGENKSVIQRGRALTWLYKWPTAALPQLSLSLSLSLSNIPAQGLPCCTMELILTHQWSVDNELGDEQTHIGGRRTVSKTAVHGTHPRWHFAGNFHILYTIGIMHILVSCNK